VVARFLFWSLRANYLELRRQAAGGVQPNLNLGMIKATRLNLPSVEEQGEIVTRIEQFLQRVDSLTQDASVPLKLLERLEQATLASAFSGKLFAALKAPCGWRHCVEIPDMVALFPKNHGLTTRN